jgi:putative toxin-antitoxin system antitoxin component (TIGR02293 family)
MASVEQDSAEATHIRATAELLGGRKVFGTIPTSELEAHRSLDKGLSRHAVRHLATRLKLLEKDALFQALGMSVRTTQRHSAAPEKPLTPDQSGRAWELASVLERACVALGTLEEAERWIDTPAMALNQMKPLDLLSTPPGRKAVDDLITRMIYGVYT